MGVGVGAGVAVGGIGVGVGTGVAVGGIGVAVGSGVAVGGIGVAVGSGVAVGIGVGAGVAVDVGTGVCVGVAVTTMIVTVGVGIAVSTTWASEEQAIESPNNNAPAITSIFIANLPRSTTTRYHYIGTQSRTRYMVVAHITRLLISWW